MNNATLERHEPVQWICDQRIDKYDMSDLRDLASPGELLAMTAEEQLNLLIGAGATPFEEIIRHGNLLVYGGASAVWERLIGTAVTAFDNTNAYIGVGDSSTAAAATQTDLQASTNKLRKVMDATYPLHTDGTTSPAATIAFRSTFGTSDANFAWNEWGLFNASTAGRMLNRKVESNGTKASGASWQFTISLTLA